MAAPMKYAFSRFSHIHLKFSRNLMLNLPLQQSLKESCKRLHYDKPISFRTVARKGRLKGFLVPATVGISGIVAGLSVFKFYSYLSKELSFPLPIQKVYASSGDILKTAGNNFIADAVDLAAPAVVFLRVKRYANYGYEESQGSGFIVRSDGLILTNAHVVRENGQITVKMKDGREFTGTVQSVDRVSDLATIRIDATDLPVIKLGDSSSLRAGEWVVALGCPLSLNFTVTVGIVSSKHRAGEEIGFRNRDNIGYIQTDAAITVGNSGGPLINLAGEAIGINTWTVKDGISFAIPSDYAKKFIERADAYAQRTQQKSSWFSRAIQPKKKYYLGITMLTLTPDLVVALRDQYAGFPPDCDHGVIVHSLKHDSPAYRAGLRAGDVIMNINGEQVASSGDVYKAVDKGAEMTLTVKRHIQTLKLRITPLEVN